MIYRVVANLFFDIEDEATDFFYDCEIALQKSITVNPSQPNEEKGHIFLERCFHDEESPQPCELLESEHTQ